MAYDDNPFSDTDHDKQQIWEMLVHRDIDAYLGQDWDMVAGDFIEEGFFGISGDKTDGNPDLWKPTYSTLADYKSDWLEQAAQTAKDCDKALAREAIFKATNMTEIDITGNLAVVHKKFDGLVPLLSGGNDRMNWQTIYICRNINGKWMIASFVGYLKYKDA